MQHPCIEKDDIKKDRARSWFDDKYRTEYEQNRLTKSDYDCLLSVQQPYHVQSLD